MASKARLFGDDTALPAILASNDPREQALGVYRFSQNEEMRVALENTGMHPLDCV